MPYVTFVLLALLYPRIEADTASRWLWGLALLTLFPSLMRFIEGRQS